MIQSEIVMIRGAGDLATGIAHKLHNCGFMVLMLEKPEPLVIRRTVAFAAAIWHGQAAVEGITAIKADDHRAVYRIWEEGAIPVMVDPACRILQHISPAVLVDATMAKRNTGIRREMAPITIGCGPGFAAGEDVDAVIETNRGHDLGRIIWEGTAQPDTGIPSKILGYGQERVIRAPVDGITHNLLEIGAQVKAGQIIGYVGTGEVMAPIDGVLRGLIMDGIMVHKGLKIADIDPRGQEKYCYTISEKARSVAGGVLEAILYLRKQRSQQSIPWKGGGRYGDHFAGENP